MKFKKLAIVFACTVTSAMLLCACGSGSANDAVSDTDSQNITASGNEEDDTVNAVSGYTYNLKGNTIYVNEDMSVIIAAVGKEDSYFESESCAFQGLDKVYTYGSVVVSTYPDGDKDYVNTIELKDDTVETQEGICIGSSKDDVISAYGTADKETDTSLTYVKDSCELSFMFDSDSVNAITYTAITE